MYFGVFFPNNLSNVGLFSINAQSQQRGADMRIEEDKDKTVLAKDVNPSSLLSTVSRVNQLNVEIIHSMLFLSSSLNVNLYSSPFHLLVPNFIDQDDASPSYNVVLELQHRDGSLSQQFKISHVANTDGAFNIHSPKFPNKVLGTNKCSKKLSYFNDGPEDYK